MTHIRDTILTAIGVWLLLFAIARADQYDIILHYASLAAAEADPLVAAHSTTDPDTGQLVFRSDHVIPDLKVWKASKDVIGTDADGNPTVTHTYLAGYFILVSIDHVIPALRDDPALTVAIDRTTRKVLKSPISLAALQDIRMSPVFAGSDYPWGAWQ